MAERLQKVHDVKSFCDVQRSCSLSVGACSATRRFTVISTASIALNVCTAMFDTRSALVW